MVTVREQNSKMTSGSVPGPEHFQIKQSHNPVNGMNFTPGTESQIILVVLESENRREG